jgi:hypothetical protein
MGFSLFTGNNPSGFRRQLDLSVAIYIADMLEG